MVTSADAPLLTPPASLAVVAEPEDALDVFLRTWAGKIIPPAVLLNAIREEAGLEEQDMAGVPMLDRADLGGGVRWDALRPPPGGQMNDYIVIAIHMGDQADRNGDQVAGDVRIYVAPVSPVDAQGLEKPYLRYTISRVPGAGSNRATMRLKLFVEEAGYELNRMAVIFDVLEDDEDEDDDEAEE